MADSVDEISVIIPAFNEDGTLGSIIERTRKILGAFGMPYEIIVADDGSTDETARIALSQDVILVSNTHNKGKGHALSQGIAKASGSIIITMDADGSHRPEEIPKLLYPMLKKNPGVPVVIGSRFTGCIEPKAISKLNLAGNVIFNLMIRILTGRRITDSQSGFRAYRRHVLEKLKVESLGFAVDTEMILKVFKENFRMKEIPITCRRRICSNSRLSPVKDGLHILKTIMAVSLGFD